MFIDWLIVLIMGGLVGWFASLVMRVENEWTGVANIFFGVVGAALGRWTIQDLMGAQTLTGLGRLTTTGLLWSVLGAAVIIGIATVSRSLRLDQERH